MKKGTGTVRLRYLQDVGRDHFVHIEDIPPCLFSLGNENGNPKANNVAQNTAREREIFLRAALQLLNVKDMMRPYYNVKPKEALSGRKANKQSHDDSDMYDVIRLGLLKKFSRGGKLTNIAASQYSHWKLKYVEVRHGVLSYDDFHGDNQGDLQDICHENSTSSTRRYIHLSIHSCICRIVDTGKDKRSCVFEIAVVGGPRRFWGTNTEEECVEWVRAVHAAMVGSNFGHVKGIDWNDKSAVLHSNLIADGDNLPPPLSGHSTTPFKQSLSSSSTVADSNWQSMDGAAALYAEDMSLFMHLHSTFLEAENESTYRKLLHSLYQDGMKLTIPVLFIKTKTKHANFTLSPQDSLIAQNFTPLCNSSQVWKDLQRDAITVNGDRVSGESGAEAMVGALVRHISDLAEKLKQHQQKVNLHQEGLQDFTLNSEFSISEALIVESARDLIALCNRTQSGGDTYFCVEALLCGGERNESRSILTPYAAEADPLTFTVDAVLVADRPGLSREQISVRSGRFQARHVQGADHLSDQCTKKVEANSGESTPTFDTSMKSEKERKAHYAATALSSSRVTKTEAQECKSGSLGQHHGQSNKGRGESRTADLLSRPLPTTPPYLSSSHVQPSDRRRLARLQSSNNHSNSRDLSGVERNEEDHEADVSDCYHNKTLRDRNKKSVNRNRAEGKLSDFLASPSSSSSSSASPTRSSEGESKKVKRRRKPQLDLRGELERDGFLFNYYPRSHSPIATFQKHKYQVKDNVVVIQNEKNVEFKTKSQSNLTLNQFIIHDSSLDTLPGTTKQVLQPTQGLKDEAEVSTALVEFHSLPASIQHALPNNIITTRDEEYSVISELTFDTYLKHHSDGNPQPPTRSLETGKLPAESHLGDEYPMKLYEESNSVEHSTYVGQKSTQKSLFRRLGKGLKPFKMPSMAESFEGLGSPFRHIKRRGSRNTNSSKVSEGVLENKHFGCQSRKNSDSIIVEDRNQHHPKRSEYYNHSGKPEEVQSYHRAHSNHALSEPYSQLDDHNDSLRKEECPYSLCIRVQVQAVSRYKVCTSNPIGIESQDTWATVKGTFKQSFLIGANSGQHLGMADRLVAIEIESCTSPTASLKKISSLSSLLPKHLHLEENTQSI